MSTESSVSGTTRPAATGFRCLAIQFHLHEIWPQPARDGHPRPSARLYATRLQHVLYTAGLVAQRDVHGVWAPQRL